MTAAYGLLAELPTAEALVQAAARAREAGFADVEAYAPFPVEGLADAVGFRRTRISAATLLGGLAGGIGAYFLQWYTAVVDYPINSGGRPLHSWPEFIPVAFEMTVLGAALAAVVAMLVANGLPRLHHPLFGIPEFDLASRNRFFLCLRATRGFDPAAARRFLDSVGPLRVTEVPA